MRDVMINIVYSKGENGSFLNIKKKEIGQEEELLHIARDEEADEIYKIFTEKDGLSKHDEEIKKKAIEDYIDSLRDEEDKRFQRGLAMMSDM